MALFSTVVSRCFPALICRSFHGSYSMRKNEWKKIEFHLEGYHKMGLYEDDCLTGYDSDLEEAIRRLPEEELMQRKYRAIRAQQAELNNSILPKDQWTKFEDEKQNYLQPYLDEVIKEREEREDWEATH